jgi:two-component system osmolarity sensor histidine kinase EnvZ
MVAPERLSISLFWRTFGLLALLLLFSVVAWFQTFRTLEEEPRAVQSARQLASLVNLTRAALVHADAFSRVSLVKTLVEQENVRIAEREASDVFLPYAQDPLTERISQELDLALGSDTVVAREVNGFAGLWIGFNIEAETYWLLADPARVGSVEGTTWLAWLGIALLLSGLGAALIARLLNRPLRELSEASARLRSGSSANTSLLDERSRTTEIRAVNRDFNRMARRLQQAEADRALMLAGISHDLRTPLARLRLETELSVPDEQARSHMNADIEQMDAIIDQFLDYARPQHATSEVLMLAPLVANTGMPFMAAAPDMALQVDIPAQLQVRAHATELQRVLSNLLENARRYGRGPDGHCRVDIKARLAGEWVVLTVRDHGAGVSPETLDRLTEPFFRADAARTAAIGSGLGLSIARKMVENLGGQFYLALASGGGLVATLTLPAN